MHWLGDAASRAGLKGALSLLIPYGTPAAEAWEISARALGLTPSALATHIAAAMRIQTADFTVRNPRSLRLVPEKLARRFNVFPLRESYRNIVLATADPHNFECEQMISFASGRRITFELAPPHLVTQAINTYYRADRSATVAEIERVVGVSAPATSSGSGARPAAPSVLVADDDPVERLLVTMALEKAGFSVTQVDDGTSALNQLREATSFALVLTDIHMKQMDGDELLRCIRMDPRLSELPVMVLTGSSEESREAEMIDAGADDYIRKPLDPARLIARVRATLRRTSVATAA